MDSPFTINNVSLDIEENLGVSISAKEINDMLNFSKDDIVYISYNISNHADLQGRTYLGSVIEYGGKEVHSASGKENLVQALLKYVPDLPRNIPLPFIKRVFSEYFDREEFIVADYLYSNDESRGMTPEQVLTLPFGLLIHGTNAEAVEKIMDSGYLKPRHMISQRFGITISRHLHSTNGNH